MEEQGVAGGGVLSGWGLFTVQLGEVDLFLFEPGWWVGQLNGFFMIRIYWLKCPFSLKK
jgi:hypothetical protein